MAPDEIPTEVKRFIARHVHSTAELEVLLLLHRTPAQMWTPERAAEALRMPVPWTAGQLASMQDSGLLAADGAGFRYRRDGRDSRTVDQLAAAYRDRKTRVVSLLYSGGADAGGSDAESFADAFRLRPRGRKQD